MAFFIAIGVIVLIVVIISSIQDRAARRRAQQVRKHAEALGFQAIEGAAPNPEAEPFILYLQGAMSSAPLVMQGQWGGVDVTLFEYRFSVPVRNFYRNWLQTVVRFSSPHLTLPSLAVMPNVIFDAMVQGVRSKELREQLLQTPYITFREHPEFSQKTRVQTADRERMRELMTSEAIAFYQDHADLCIEGDSDVLIVYRYDDLVPAGELKTFLDEALAVYRIFETPTDGA